MEKAIVELLARRAGLDKALAEFHVDVAAEQASGAVAKMKVPTDPRAEPWPPMRTGPDYERPTLDDGGRGG